MSDDWRDEAACRDSDPDLWCEPDQDRAQGDGKEPQADATIRIARAKEICAGCPVKAECLADAEAADDRDMIRGELTPKERDALRRGPRPRKPRPIDHGGGGGANAHRRRGETPCADCAEAANRAKRASSNQQRAAKRERLDARRRVQVHTLALTGMTKTAIAAAVGASPRTVVRILHGDPT